MKSAFQTSPQRRNQIEGASYIRLSTRNQVSCSSRSAQAHADRQSPTTAGFSLEIGRLNVSAGTNLVWVSHMYPCSIANEIRANYLHPWRKPVLYILFLYPNEDRLPSSWFPLPHNKRFAAVRAGQSLRTSETYRRMSLHRHCLRLCLPVRNLSRSYIPELSTGRLIHVYRPVDKTSNSKQKRLSRRVYRRQSIHLPCIF